MTFQQKQAFAAWILGTIAAGTETNGWELDSMHCLFADDQLAALPSASHAASCDGPNGYSGDKAKINRAYTLALQLARLLRLEATK